MAGAPRITMVLMAFATSADGLAVHVDLFARQLALVDHHDGVVAPLNRRKHIRSIVLAMSGPWELMMPGPHGTDGVGSSRN